ncbi:hypothetical protein Xen7305DRAFT_00016520 [Xenococcus sp. PCC 7305]|uniref:GrrA/OscA1 family cyclophane-containing rSAM-modified RiPP n=1 Tax=Xenococcus sp. PCC 7305 TaxID=102125 RepID=UPI0002ABA92F|nr:GrrA/OscA1 family cyclophane-containing rSAM-modified RiPP [Xenococcus sp. PCC 7305]ELS01943.1 hypothetical protein Xen7305DRAFT_00016520 [Xenococcus sp. PCC 7305]
MKLTKITWISFIVALATLNSPAKTKAYPVDSTSSENTQMLESRLAKIAATLKERETKVPTSSALKKNLDIASWIKGRRGGFADGGGGSFLNRRSWGDGGGFLNRRY